MSSHFTGLARTISETVPGQYGAYTDEAEIVYVPVVNDAGMVTLALNTPSGPATVVPRTIGGAPSCEIRIVTVSPG